MTPRVPEAAAGPQHLSRADAVGDLYRRHAVGLVRIALLLVGDQASAEDVVHEAFLGLYRNWPTLNDYSRLVGYLRVAVVNGSRGGLRARRRIGGGQQIGGIGEWSPGSRRPGTFLAPTKS